MPGGTWSDDMAGTRRDLSALDTLFADNSAGDISAQDGRDAIYSSHPERACQSDTFANEPSSGRLAGDLFLPNDSVYAERWSGSAWLAWGPVFPLTKPVSGDFAWVNQGSASVTTTQGGVHLSAPTNGGAHNYRIRKKAAPATPYTITACFLPLVAVNATASYGMMGPCFRQSSDGKLAVFEFMWTSDTNAELHVRNMTDASNLSTNPLSVKHMGNSPVPLWMRIADDGTDRKCSLSPDGRNWLEVHSVGRTSFLTADEVGFCVNPYSLPTSMTLLSWKEA